MSFEELISKYGQKELAFEFVTIEGEKITFLVDSHGNDENGDIKYGYFKVQGNFKLHTFRDEDGWSADCSTILSYDIHIVDEIRKIYALYEIMHGVYIEFSVDNCQVEELSWEEYNHQCESIRGK